MYVHQTASGTIIFTVHIDNIFSIANPPEENTKFWELLKSKWDISDLGPIKFALGIAIKHNTNMIALSQTAFIDHLIKQFRQTNAHAINMPMVAGLQLC